MSHTGESLVEMGQEASFLYFKDNAPLTDSIIKIAAVNDLNPEQIKRVCHAANQSTMIQIYKSANDNTSEFEVADPNKVISALGQTKKAQMVASTDYSKSPRSDLTSEIKLASDESIPGYKLKERYLELRKEEGKLEGLLKNAEEDCLMAHFKYAGALDALYGVVRQAILKGYDFADMLRAALAAVPSKASEVKDIMITGIDSIAKKLTVDPTVPSGIKGMFTGSELLKVGSPVPEELISNILQELNGKVPLTIINGDQRFFGVLRMIYDDKKSIHDSNRVAGDIRNKLTVVRKEIGALKEREGDWY